MIGDVLFDALDEIDRYQRDFGHCYDDMRPEIDSVKTVMRSLLLMLDGPPDEGPVIGSGRPPKVYVPVYFSGYGVLGEFGREVTEADLFDRGKCVESGFRYAADMVAVLRRAGWTAREAGRDVACTHHEVRTEREAEERLLSLGIDLEDVVIVA